MTGKDLFFAMGGIKAEYILDAAPSEDMVKKPYIKWLSVAASFVLVVAIALTVLPRLLTNDDGSIGTPLPSDMEIVWYEDVEYVGGTSGTGERVWRGVTVDAALYEVLSSMDGEKYIAVTFSRADGEPIAQSEYGALPGSVKRDHRRGILYLFVSADELSSFAEWGGTYVFRLAKMNDYLG